ncbi:MAG: MotA/TolQ/ExbB proton channel family protein [Bacteroidota bacterium]
MSKSSSLAETLKSGFAAIVIPLSVVIAYFIYTQILGNPGNFEGGDVTAEPLEGNYLGVIHKGGPIVILLVAFQVILLTFIIERLVALYRASGSGRNGLFVRKIKGMLDNNQLNNALEACDTQKGSVANVIKNGLNTFQEMSQEGYPMAEEQKVETLQKELEEATQLELPLLSNNLVIISTLASVATLIGLLGTVTGMIKAFAALARAGSPDAIGLAGGISQALVTTALGISTAAVAIIFYNYFASRIDKLVYAIDEASYSILHAFKTRKSLRAAFSQNGQAKAKEAVS